jgi:transcriptional regulator with XRE-family HTH domain
MSNLGQLIRNKRQQNNLLLRELAAVVEIDTAVLSKIERGERLPTDEHIEKFSKALNLELKQLIENHVVDKIIITLDKIENPLEVIEIIKKKIKLLQK